MADPVLFRHPWINGLINGCVVEGLENCFKKGVYVQRGLIILSKPFGTEDGRSITYFLYLLSEIYI